MAQPRQARFRLHLLGLDVYILNNKEQTQSVSLSSMSVLFKSAPPCYAAFPTPYISKCTQWLCIYLIIGSVSLQCSCLLIYFGLRTRLNIASFLFTVAAYFYKHFSLYELPACTRFIPSICFFQLSVTK